MATSFVEQATLRVKNESSKELKKITSDIRKLFKEAGKELRIPVKFAKVATARADLNRTLATGPAARIAVRLAGVAAARRAMVSQLASTSARVNLRAGSLTALRASLTAGLSGRPVGVPFKFTGIPAARRALQAALKTPPVRVPAVVSATNAGPQPAPTGGPRRQPAPRPLGGYRPQGAFSALSTLPYPANVPTAFNIAAAYLTVRGALTVTRTSLAATGEAQNAATKTDLIVQDVAERERIRSIARENVRTSDQVNLATSENLTRDLFVTGFRGEVLAAVAPVVTGLVATAAATNPEQAKALTTLANKLGNLAAVTEDPKRAAKLISGVLKAAVVQGETFAPASLISAIRIGGVAQSIDEEGLIRVAASTDELGRSTGSGLMRLGTIMTTQLSQAGQGSGVAKGTVEALIASGLRTAEGPVQPELFARDRLGWAEEVVGELVRRRGLDPRDAEDRGEVAILLSQVGILGTAQRLVLNELAAGAEREKALKLAKTLDPENVKDATALNFGFQVKNLIEQFKSFSSEFLTPFAEAGAPIIKTIADVTKELALMEGAGANVKRGFAALAVGLAGLGLVKGTSGLLGKLNPAAGLLKAATTMDIAANKMLAAANKPAVGRGASAPGRGVSAVGVGSAAPKVAGFTAGQKTLGALNVLGLASMVVNDVGFMNMPKSAQEQVIVDRTARQDAWWEEANRKIEDVLPVFFSDILKSREAAKAERVDAGTASLLDRIGSSLAVRPLPASATSNNDQSAAAATAEAGVKIATTLFNDPRWQKEPAYARETNALLARLARLQEKIIEPGRSPESIANLQGDKARTEARLAELGTVAIEPVALAFSQGAQAAGATMDDAFRLGGEQMDQTFTYGATLMKSGLDEAAAAFGPQAGSGLLPFATQFGAIVGDAIVARAGSITLKTKAQPQTGRLDTGRTLPNSGAQ